MTNIPLQNENSKATLVISYTSVVDFSIVDPFEPTIHHYNGYNPEVLPFEGLQSFTFQPFEHETRRYIQINCVVEYKIRKDKKEYEVLKGVLDGGELDNNYNAVMYNRVSQYEKFVKKLMDYIIWRKKIYIIPPFSKIIDTQHCTWTLDGESREHNARKQWYAIGEPIEIEINDKAFKYDDLSDFPKFSATNTSKPLYHELLDEAYRLVVSEQYRGAYLTLYTALEVGTKELAALLAPETDWIINNTQAPPLDEIYITIINSENRIVLDNSDMNKLRNMTSKRNLIAHRGVDIDGGEFRRYRNFVRKVLYRIDAQMGYAWAETESESTYYEDPNINMSQISV